MSAQFSIPTMIFTNPTDHVVKLDSVGLDPVQPKSDCEIPLSLAAPYLLANGARGKSSIEQVAPQLHPKDPTDHQIWKQAPKPIPQESKIVSVSQRPPSEAPGVKALLAAKAQAKPVAAPTANVSTPAGK